MKQEIRIASPCSADWNRMAGNERVRYCPDCNLNVYNFSEMPDADIESILTRRDGRLCARFYQRSDGTMLTHNCPVGLRAVVRRVATFAGAALAAVMSVGPAFARAPLASHVPALFQIQPAQTELSLEVFDTSGATVSKARITIVDEKTKVRVYGETDAKGRLRLADLPTGNYEITVVVPGFKELKQSHVSVPTKIPLRLQIEVGVMGEVVVVEGPQVEPKSVPICKTLIDPTSQKPK
jgi:Carboxypeptidase regulatory-like domain